jgi:hypothetical protein
MQTLLLVACCVLVLAIFVTGFILDRKNRKAEPLSKSEASAEREWLHAIR